MPYKDRELLKDLRHNPIPQEFDPVADVYKPLTKKNFYGYSNETKPTTVDKGATYYEFDTKKGYVFDGTTWVVL